MLARKAKTAGWQRRSWKPIYLGFKLDPKSHLATMRSENLLVQKDELVGRGDSLGQLGIGSSLSEEG